MTMYNIIPAVLKIVIKSYVGEQNPNLIQLSNVKLFDWTYLSQSSLSHLQWESIINAGR